MGNPEKDTAADQLPPSYSPAHAQAHPQDAPTDAPPDYALGISPYPSIPLSLNIYNKRWSFGTYTLGEHADRPCFELRIHSGLFSSKPFITLRSMASQEVASITSESITRASTVITVPGRPGSARTTIQERLERRQRLPLEVFGFSFDVGRGKETRREAFEWRFSRGKEVKTLGKWTAGWKLVRLDATVSGGSRQGGSSSQRQHGETSDGKPVVAVVAENTSPSSNKQARFHFVGAGATDELGEPWAFMVLMSAVRVWERQSDNPSGR